MLMVSGMLLGGTTGCSMLSALANPSVAFALNEPAPMPVVTRRAATAAQTADHVERLLLATPTDDDSAWVKELSFTDKQAKAAMRAAKKYEFYASDFFDFSGSDSIRVLPVEAWTTMLGSVRSKERAYPNLLTMIHADLGAGHERVVRAKSQVSSLEGQLRSAKKKAKAAKAKEDKEKYKKAIEGLEEKIEEAKEQRKALTAKFLEQAKAHAAKSSSKVRSRVGQAIVNLRQAVDDAEVANGAAIVRYPLAIPEVHEDIERVVPVIVADILEEQTGKRPNVKRLKPKVDFDGIDVKLELNGLNKKDLGKVKMGDLVNESASRTAKWAGEATSLLGKTSSTADRLAFQADILDAIQDGFKSAGWNAPKPLRIRE